MQKRYKKLDKMYNSLWKLVDRDNVDIYEFRNQVINAIYNLENKLESLQNSELKESIRKLNMDVESMRGSLEIFENKVGSLEEKFKIKF